MADFDLSRAGLEAMSFSELMEIADSLGIDVPDNFKRNALIGEILELANEDRIDEDDTDFILDDDNSVESADMLPRPYNLTEVKVVLRNPAWAFVYWNISDLDSASLDNAFISQLLLRISSFSNKDDAKPDDFFDLKIKKADNGQYVLLPAGVKFLRADLIFDIDGIIAILASSEMIQMPNGSKFLSDFRPGHFANVSAVLELSGIKKLMADMYKNHRESFS